MLTLYDNRGARSEAAAEPGRAVLPPDIVWIDLLKPEASEIAFVEKTTSLAVPSRDELSEIESSSRLRARDGALYLSLPLIYTAEPDEPMSTPVGLVLTGDRLITVRFAELPSFASFADRTLSPEGRRVTSAGIFTELLEALVDRLADALERSASELDSLSHRLFRAGPAGPLSRRRSTGEADLRVILRRVGHNGDLTSKIRDSLLGIARIVPFVLTLAADWLPHELKPRLETLRQDIASLNDYDAHLLKQGPAAARRHIGADQHRPEQHHQSPDDRLGGRCAADAGRQYVWHELRAHAGAPLGVGLPLWPCIDRAQRDPSAAVVQMAGWF